MSNQKIDLALAFIESKPGVAAGVLEQQPLEDVAHFLNEIPYNYAAPVLDKMLPQYTARLCSLLDSELSAGFLSHMNISLAAAVLRHSKKDVSKKIFSLLPEKTKIACKLLLSYSEDAVGAWMVAHVATLPNDCTVGDALKRIASQEDAVDTDAIYIVDRERLLQGLVRATTLLQSNSDVPITSVMQKKPDIVNGRASLFSVTSHNGWVLHDTLPVVNRSNQLVGMLRHVDLRKGLDQISTTIDTPRGSDPITNICEVYGGSLLALFNTVGEMATTKRHQGEQ